MQKTLVITLMMLSIVGTTYSQVANILQPVPGSIVADAKKNAKKDVPPEKTTVDITGGATGEIGNGDTKGIPQFGGSYWKGNDYFFSFLYSVGTPKTITTAKDFGQFLFNPSVSPASFYASGGRNFSKTSNWGVFGRVGYSSVDLEASIENTSGQIETQMENGNVVVFSFGPQFLSSTIDLIPNNAFQVGIQIGPTIRYIGGDLANKDQFREQSFKVKDTSYLGIEGTIFVKLNNIAPFLRINWFQEKSGQSIDGFSGLQGLLGVDVLATLVKLK